MLGAIVIAGADVRDPARSPLYSAVPGISPYSIEVLGRPVVSLIGEYLRRGVEAISVFTEESAADTGVSDPTRGAWFTAMERLLSFTEEGLDFVLVLQAGAYIEFDPALMAQFHQESDQAVTRAFDDHGPLNLWVVEPARVVEQDGSLAGLLASTAASYRVPGYVNRLENPYDLRQLVADSLSSRCQLRPQGSEIRPGIWMGEGAEVDRGARIVAPAFVGRGAKIADECLITRCSNVERNSHIDFGTVVEDSSVLANTYVGIGLDVCHSVLGGNILANMRHDVVMEISDPVVMRPTTSHKAERILPEPIGLGEMSFSSPRGPG